MQYSLREQKFQGTKVPQSESSIEVSFPGAKRPGSERAREQKFQGARRPGSEKARERKGQEAIVPGSKLARVLLVDWPGSEKARYRWSACANSLFTLTILDCNNGYFTLPLSGYHQELSQPNSPSQHRRSYFTTDIVFIFLRAWHT